MKVTATVGGSLVQRTARRTGLSENLSARVRRHLEIDLRQELQAITQSGRAADPEARRDALERAVRRIWGAPL